jgi:hypothetical protein
MGEHPAASIFISYSQDDHYITQTLIELLKESGYHLWTTLYSVLDQTEWQTLSRDALGRSQVCLIVLTPEALAEPRVQYEMTAARETNCAIIPLVFRTCAIPAGLSPVDFRGNLEQARRELTQRLAAALGDIFRYPDNLLIGVDSSRLRGLPAPIEQSADGIPNNIRRIMANPLIESMGRQPVLFRKQKKDAQILIDAQNDGILPYPEPTSAMSGDPREDEVTWVIETDMSPSAVLSGAREYLELADYRPLEDLEKQKRGSTLLYTRGSAARAQLTDSPKQVRTDVTITATPAPGTQNTQVEIRYALKIPPMWQVTVPERLFWIAEIRELGQAVMSGVVNRDDSGKRVKAIYRGKSFACCGCYLILITTVALVWIIVMISPRRESLDWEVLLLTAGFALLIVAFIMHFTAAWRWSR